MCVCVCVCVCVVINCLVIMGDCYSINNATDQAYGTTQL